MKVDLIAREAAELYESGLSIEQVAAKLGVAYRTARKAIRMAGVENRGPSERLVGRTRPDKAAERAEAERYAETGAAIPDAAYVESLRERRGVYADPSQEPFAYSEAGAAQIEALLAAGKVQSR